MYEYENYDVYTCMMSLSSSRQYLSPYMYYADNNYDDINIFMYIYMHIHICKNKCMMTLGSFCQYLSPLEQ